MYRWHLKLWIKRTYHLNSIKAISRSKVKHTLLSSKDLLIHIHNWHFVSHWLKCQWKSEIQLRITNMSQYSGRQKTSICWQWSRYEGNILNIRKKSTYYSVRALERIFSHMPLWPYKAQQLNEFFFPFIFIAYSTEQASYCQRIQYLLCA